MGTFTSWLRGRKQVASVTALAVLVGVPLGFAVLHQGFPVTDPDLRAREVWVTNAEELLAALASHRHWDRADVHPTRTSTGEVL